jgi:hypothetical protein
MRLSIPAPLRTGLKRESIASAAVALAVIGLGIASLLLYDNARFLQRFTQGISAYIFHYLAQFVLYLFGCYAILRRPRYGSTAATVLILSLVLLFAALFRERLVTQPPYLSSDVHRYVWDGRVQAAGVNPYRYLPSAPELNHLRDEEIYPGINRRDYAQTIYPPVAQAIFLLSYLISPMSITTFKLLMILFDGVAAAALIGALVRLRLDPARVIIFAWHPLVVWEGAHSGHIESAALAFIAVAIWARILRRDAVTGVAIAAATLVKLYPLLLLPFFSMAYCRKPDDEAGDKQGRITGAFERAIDRLSGRTLIAFVATVVLAYLPYLTVGERVVGFLFGYFQEEGFVDTGSRYFLLDLLKRVVHVPTEFYLVIAALSLILFVGWWLLRRAESPMHAIRGSLGAISLFLILTSPRYGWYAAWIVPFICFVPHIAWFYLTGASVFLYLLWLTPSYPEVPLWLGAALYVPTAVLLLVKAAKGRLGINPFRQKYL